MSFQARSFLIPLSNSASSPTPAEATPTPIQTHPSGAIQSSPHRVQRRISVSIRSSGRLNNSVECGISSLVGTSLSFNKPAPKTITGEAFLCKNAAGLLSSCVEGLDKRSFSEFSCTRPMAKDMSQCLRLLPFNCRRLLSSEH